jgi:hypothetical protein
MARLDGATCRRCKGRFGERMASLMVRVRVDPSFAQACFARIRPEHRPWFLEWFGDPTSDLGSETIARR